MFLVNRRFAELAVFVGAALVVGGFVLARGARCRSTVHDIWATLTGCSGRCRMGRLGVFPLRTGGVFARRPADLSRRIAGPASRWGGVRFARGRVFRDRAARGDRGGRAAAARRSGSRACLARRFATRSTAAGGGGAGRAGFAGRPAAHRFARRSGRGPAPPASLGGAAGATGGRVDRLDGERRGALGRLRH